MNIPSLFGFCRRFPKDYPDVWIEEEDGEPNWQVMGQWHQQPDFESGQTWDDFPGQGQSPPIAFNYYFLSSADTMYAALKSDPRILDVHGFDTTWENVSVLMLTYGTPPLPVEAQKIEKGKWLDIQISIHWSTSDTGWVLASLNGNTFTSERHYGPICGILNLITSKWVFTEIRILPGTKLCIMTVFLLKLQVREV